MVALREAVGLSDVVFLLDGPLTPSVDYPARYVIGSEVVNIVGGKSTAAISVVRGIESTTIASHAKGAALTFAPDTGLDPTGVAISALPAVVTPAGTDEFPVNQGGVTKKMTLAQVGASAVILNTGSEAFLANDVVLTTGGTFYDGPSLSLAPGTWLVLGYGLLRNLATATWGILRLWDGTNVFHEADGKNMSTSYDGIALAVGAVITLAVTTTVKISASNSIDGGTWSKTAVATGGTAGKRTKIVAVRLA